MSLNRVVIMGRLTRDPELRRTQTGTAVTSFSLAVDRDFKSRESGEKATDFIDVVAWRQTAEFVCQYFAKGRMAVVEGRLQIRDWKDKDGNNRRSAEVVADNVYFGDSKRDGASGGDYAPPAYGSPASTYSAPRAAASPRSKRTGSSRSDKIYKGGYFHGYGTRKQGPSRRCSCEPQAPQGLPVLR